MSSTVSRRRHRSMALSSVLMAVFLSSCATTSEPPEPPPVPQLGGSDDLTNPKYAPMSYKQFASRAKHGKLGGNDVAEQRYSVLRDAALAYGAQAGFERRSWEIMNDLERESVKLSETFNFNRVAFKAPRETGYVLPPVITRATSAINVTDNGRKSVAADEYYRIEEPGRLVAILPTWRDYLVLPLDEPREPDDRLLPQDDDETKIWSQYLDEGWAQGKQQADAALQENMNLLRRDYLGMVEYRKAVEAGLITNLVLKSSETRATGGVNELYIGERRVEIDDAARFVKNPAQWKPIRRRFQVTK
ncbi:type IV secretory system conjugative DNA transfer family protein [Martelella mangrovi]|uniref:Defect-in-organelle-trafficking protein DotC n=1 Tax=Martelella mangrovi TaxID=1397477 RepID=A0ABV2IDJ3_9HYPH